MEEKHQQQQQEPDAHLSMRAPGRRSDLRLLSMHGPYECDSTTYSALLALLKYTITQAPHRFKEFTADHAMKVVAISV